MPPAEVTARRPDQLPDLEEERPAAPAPASRPTREALGDLYDVHGARLFRFLLALLGNVSDAEDALQTTFLELARRPELLHNITSPLAYTLKTARHVALRLLRRSDLLRRREATASQELILEARAPAAPDPAEAEALQQAMLALPIEQREVLVLKAFEDLTFREIGEALDLSPHTAASRYRYALDKLRELLDNPRP